MAMHQWIEESVDWPPQYNAAPSQMLPVVTASRKIELFKWGLIPGWADDPAVGNRMINARAETLTVKAAFKKLLATRRCIIPANGFYEWKKEGTHRMPYYIAQADGTPMAFAGLWDTWQGRAGVIHSFTIITTTSNAQMARIHDRMPAILPPEHYTQWLSRPMALEPYPADTLTARIITMKVNNPRHNSPDILDP